MKLNCCAISRVPRTLLVLTLLLAVFALQPAWAQGTKSKTKTKPAAAQADDTQEQSESAAADTPAAAEASNGSSDKLMLMITVFVLAVFVGFEIITKIPPTLHTPLMSGSNAISGITVVGALLATGAREGGFATFLGFLAVVLATVNVVGGFLVTHRMLEMFSKKKTRNS